MEHLTNESIYISPQRKPPFLIRKLCNWIFYSGMVTIVLKASKLSKRNKYTGEEWVKSSLGIKNIMEFIGTSFKIENLDSFRKLRSPCVFISNHMSTLETFLFPGILRPYRQITFIVKQSLVEYPVFKHVMINCNPIVVGRTNPRKDLQTVLQEGEKRLRDGISVVVFPQTTRSKVFDPKHFNTIGIKLAKRANVPAVPVALKTDAWGNGKWIKDFGKIDPDKNVHICFGDPLRISGTGRKEHETIIQFIIDKLKTWSS